MLKEGRKIVYILSVISLLVWVLSYKIKILLPVSILLCCLVLLLINFFRDPQRNIRKDPRILYSPADGKIFDIVEYEDRYCIKIFMTIFDVHIQRSPVDGVVTKINYKKGKFYPAGKNKTELYNEQNVIEIKNDKNEIFVVTQIAGILARRIICWVKEKDGIRQGSKLGAILLGSQVNFEFPKGNYKILVSKKQKVYSGITPMAVKVS